MLETTENVNLFLPIIFALFTSFGVGRIFNRSLYVGSVRFKNIPFLLEKVPKCNRSIIAEEVMSSPVYYLNVISSVKSIYGGLQKSEFNGFPIVDENEKLVGLIGRNFLWVLIKNKCWKRNDITRESIDQGVRQINKMKHRGSDGTNSNYHDQN